MLARSNWPFTVATSSADAWSPPLRWLTGDARVEQRLRDVDVSLARRVEKRRHAALPRHLLVEHVLALDAGDEDPRRRRAASLRA